MEYKKAMITELPKGQYRTKEGKLQDVLPSKLGDKIFVGAYLYRESTGSIFSLKIKYDNKDNNPKKRDKAFIVAHRPPGDNQPWVSGHSRETAYPPLKADCLKEFPRSPALFVEGEKDATCGLAMAIERDLGIIVTAANLGESQTDYSLISRRKEVYYYPDGDDSGYKKAWKFLEKVPGAIILRPVFSEIRKKCVDLYEMEEDGYNSFSIVEILEGTNPIDPVELMELAGVEQGIDLSQDPEFVSIPNHKTAGDLLEKKWRGEVIWVDNEAQFYKFDGSKWAGFNDIKNTAYNVFYDLVIEFSENKPEKAAEILKGISKQTKAFIRDTLEFFKGHPTIYRKDVMWDGRMIDMTLTASDGVLDFSKGKIEKREGRKDEYRRTYLPMLCDEVIKAKRPDYFLDTMIDGVMPDAENQDTLLSWISLIPTRFTEGKKGAFFIGEGNTGKTTLIEIIVELFPRLTKKLPSSVLLPSMGGFGTGNNATPEQAGMEGKLLCYTSETEKGKKLSNNLFKELTGGEEITARELYQKSKTFKPTFQILISTNHPPRFDGTDKATYNRILPIVFEQVHDEGQEGTISGDEIKRKCLEEWPGIIKLLCEKAISVRANNNIIPISPRFLEFKERYREQQKGDIDLFIDDVLVPDEKSFVSMHELKDVFCEYMDMDDRGKEKIDIRLLNSIIRSKWSHVEKRRRMIAYNGMLKQFNGLQGIKIKPSEEWEFNPEKEDKKYTDEIPF